VDDVDSIDWTLKLILEEADDTLFITEESKEQTTAPAAEEFEGAEQLGKRLVVLSSVSSDSSFISFSYGE